MAKPKNKKGNEFRPKEGVFSFAPLREALKVCKDSKICSKEELLSFVSFYKRFKRLISLPLQSRKIDDVHYEKAELIDNLVYFFALWTKILVGLTARGEIVELHTKPQTMIDIIFLAEGHPQMVDDPLPRGMISLKPDEWRERDWAEWDLDRTMAKLCRHLGITREELVGEKPIEEKQRMKPDEGPSRDGEKDATATKEPVTLIEFMQRYCESQKLELLKCRRKSLNDAHNRKTINLPRHIGKWKSGKKKYYNASELKDNWPSYREILPNLPQLRQ